MASMAMWIRRDVTAECCVMYNICAYSMAARNTLHTHTHIFNAGDHFYCPSVQDDLGFFDLSRHFQDHLHFVR